VKKTNIENQKSYYYLRQETKQVLDATWEICCLQSTMKDGYLRYIKINNITIRVWPEGLFLGTDILIDNEICLNAGRSILSGAWYFSTARPEPPAEQMKELALYFKSIKAQLEKEGNTRKHPIEDLEILDVTIDSEAMKRSHIKIKGILPFTYIWGKKT
jgi:hypothetical protein